MAPMLHVLLLLSTLVLQVQCRYDSFNWKKTLLLAEEHITSVLAGNSSSGSQNSTVQVGNFAFNIQISPPPFGNVSLEPQFFPNYNSKKVQMQYGPFMVPPMDQGDGMIDYLQVASPMPCTNCTLTYIQAGLMYPNGTYANANTSLWMHHILFINLHEPDTVCGRDYYGKGQRWFASGNERTPGDISKSGAIPTGYFLAENANQLLIVELMNQAMYSQDAIVTVDFEYIEGSPEGFYNSTPVWLDIAGCDIPSDMPPLSASTFSYNLNDTWNSQINGAVTGMGAHLHDGGTHLEIIKNGEEQCNCVAYYGQEDGFLDEVGVSMTMPMDPSFVRMKHISSITGCQAPTSMVEMGSEWSITAYYNFTEYAPMTELDGDISDIMGISVVYIATNMTQSEMQSFAGTNVLPLDVTPEPTAVAAENMPMPSDDDDSDSGDDDGGDDGGMNMSDMNDMPMKCIPARDSPGDITTKFIDMTDPDVAMGYLMAIMNDTCLQVWANDYARYFWYGIVTVIALCTMFRFLTWANLSLRSRGVAANRTNPTGLPKIVALPLAYMNNAIRLVSYPQYTPRNFAFFCKVPASGDILMILGYFGFLMALEFINVSTGDNQTWQNLSVRAAWLSVAQVPLLVLLANKRNFIQLFTAVSYERLNVLHRWTARGLLVTACMHLGFQATGWAKHGVFKIEWDSDECIPTGLAAFVFVLWMNISTLAPIRNWWYEFFVVQHIITFMGTIIAITYHVPDTALYARTYLYIAVGFYLFSRIVQGMMYIWYNLHPPRASVARVSSEVTKITIKNSYMKSWSPGSHLLLSIPSYGLIQSHPATIATTPNSQSGNLVFFLRKQGGFSKKLTAEHMHSESHLAMIEGPYGGSHNDFAAYQSVVLIAGSTGISFTLPILLDLASRTLSKRLFVQEIHFIWATKEASFVAALSHEFSGAIDALRSAGINVFASVHITGKQDSTISTSDLLEISEVSSHEDTDSTSNSEKGDEITSEKIVAYGSRVKTLRTNSNSSSSNTLAKAGVAISCERPDLRHILTEAQAQSQSEMGVACCGPLEMGVDVRNVVAGLEFRGGPMEQGVYLHVEGYGW